MMRVFQITLNAPDSYAWTANHGSYDAEYKDRRESYPARLEAFKFKLQIFGIEFNGKSEPLLVNEVQLLDLVTNKIEHTLVCEVPVPKSDPISAIANFEIIANRLMQLPALQAHNYEHKAYNERVNIHMPGNALTSYNEVMLLEDGCSDALQSYLDKGFRIIAACPQPDSRRPDYILGRYSPDHEVGNIAERGHNP